MKEVLEFIGFIILVIVLLGISVHACDPDEGPEIG
jgi:hypothetical protein